jgi:hypothetical protein
MWLCGGGGGGWHWVDAAFGLAKFLASIPAGEGCQWCTITLRALLALC